MKDKTAKREQNDETREALRLSPVYAACAALLTLIGLGGLLIGYYTGRSPVGFSVAGGAPLFKGSLIGIAYEIMQGSIPMPSVGPLLKLSQAFPLFLYLAVIFLVSAIGLSFLMTIIAILSPRASKKMCLRIGKLLLLGYVSLFFGNFLYRSLLKEESLSLLLDVPTALASCLLLFVLVFLSLFENRAKGAMNLFMLVFSVCPLIALTLPGSPISSDVEALVLFGGARGEEAKIALMILCGVSLFNLFFSLVRLNAKRGYFFDFLRFSLEGAAEVLLFLAYQEASGSISAFFSLQPLSSALLIASALLAVFTVLLFFALSGRKKEKPKSTAQEKPVQTPLPSKPYAQGFDLEEQPSSRGAV